MAAGPFLGLFFLSLGGYHDNAGGLAESSFRWLFMWAALPSLLGAWIIRLFSKEVKKEPVTDVITPVHSFPNRITGEFLKNNLKSLFFNKPVFYLILSYFSLSLAAVPLPMILFYVYQEIGLGLNEGLIIFMAYLLTYSVGLLYPAGFITNRLGSSLSHLVAGLLCAGAFFLLLRAKSSFLLIIAMILYGLFASIWELLRRTTQVNLTELSSGRPDQTGPEQEFGTSFSIFCGLAGFLSPVLLGVCWEMFSARFAFIIAVIFCVISIIILNYAQRVWPDEKN